LQLQGPDHRETAQALRDGDFARMPITPADRLLLAFVRTLTVEAHRVTDAQVQGLREAGWSDAQIAEAAYEAAFFAFCTRLADAFGITPPAFMDRDGVPAVLGKRAEGLGESVAPETADTGNHP
jgi:alkylhydroperoxidase/carboxymuconolactone decarboxylase family protein YurZ